MLIERETGAYNQRRYGKPWIARVTFDTPKGEFQFGDFVGRPGAAGLLVLDANPGDIVARGQKDHRGNNTAVDYYQVAPDGTLSPLDSKAEAYKSFRKIP